MSMIRLFLSFIIAAAVSAQEQYFVPCQYTSHCKCPSTVEVCTFDLVVEEIRLFTKYAKNDLSQPLDISSAQHCTLNANGDYINKDGNECACTQKEGCFGPIIADGKIDRRVIAVNRGLPGPTLIVHEGQTVIVNVENRYSANISIHWHGMHQKKTNWMDGVDSVTQFGIYPGKKFRYIFKPWPTGTYWYHAHSELQRVNGLFGALVILERTLDSSLGNFIDLPEIHTMTFIDWNVVEVDDGPVTYSPDGAEVGTDPFTSGLINGKGRHPLSDISQLCTFNVSAGQRYRFRLIGVQNYYGYRFSIDGHKLKLIATDGAFIQPTDVDYIIVHAGERYDFILETKNLPEIVTQTDFMIRADTLEVLVDDNSGSYQPNINHPSHTYNLLLNHSAEAVLRYDMSNDQVSVPMTQPYTTVKKDTDIGSSRLNCTESSPCLAVNCPFKKFPDSYNTQCLHTHELTALDSSSKLHELPMASPDQTIFLNFGMEGPKGEDSINGRSMQLPSYPPSLDTLPKVQRNIELCTNLDKSSQCDDLTTEANCRCPHIVSVGKDETIRMVFSMVRVKRSVSSKEDPRKYFAHPVHLHGHYFRVVDIQFGQYYDDSGRLTAANSEPDCTGSTIACTNPQWKNAASNIATGSKYASDSGMIRSTYPLKDTVLIPAGGYAVVYFKSNNPGVWFLHCHIGDHQVSGMSMAISEDATNIGMPPLGMFKKGEDFNWTLDEFNYLFDDSNGNGATDATMANFKLVFCCVSCTILFLFSFMHTFV